MASSAEQQQSGRSCVAAQSMRCLAEMCGIASLSEEACQLLADQADFRLRTLIQQGLKFARHGKRRRLRSADLAAVLRQRRIEPPYAYEYAATLPMQSVQRSLSPTLYHPSSRMQAPGGKRLFFQESEEVDLTELASQPLPRLPVGACLKAHWLCIDGCQPAIAENPPPRPATSSAAAAAPAAPGAAAAAGAAASSASRARRRVGGAGLLVDFRSRWADAAPLAVGADGPGRPAVSQIGSRRAQGAGGGPAARCCLPRVEREQQMFFREISEACVGSQEDRRTEALQSLATDSGLQQILPRLIVFVAEGVRVNSLTNNLALLIYLMRILQFLLQNPHLQLERYLHLILPSILTCVLGKQLCQRPETDNHWALRDFSAKQLGAVCSKFASPSNQLYARVCRLLVDYMARP
uniref:Histone H4 n=1 Tax=Macrostomum lignano TaxID=282301 RepID=A0A1I8HDK5_9PLAT